MLTVFVLNALLQKENLPFEEQVLTRFRAVCEAAAPGRSMSDLGKVRDRVFLSGKLASLRFEKGDLVWNARTGELSSFRSWGTTSPSTKPIARELLRNRAERVMALVTDAQYRYRIRQADESERTTSYYVEVTKGGVPIQHADFQMVTLDRFTGVPQELRVARFKPDVSGLDTRKALPLDVLRAKACQVYSQTHPLPLARTWDWGLRAVTPRTELAKGPPSPGLVYVDWIPPDAKKRGTDPVLAFSMAFEWQSIVLDAITGETLFMFGFDLGGRQDRIEVEGKVWSLPGDTTDVGSLSLTVQSPDENPVDVVLLSRDGIAAHGQFKKDAGTLTVGKETYSVTGKLLDALRRRG